MVSLNNHSRTKIIVSWCFDFIEFNFDDGMGLIIIRRKVLSDRTSLVKLILARLSLGILMDGRYWLGYWRGSIRCFETEFLLASIKQILIEGMGLDLTDRIGNLFYSVYSAV